MKIILDVNIVISALIKDSITREIITKSEHEFYFPVSAKKKIIKYEKVIIKKSGLRRDELKALSEGIFSSVTLVADENLQEHKKAAKKIMDHIDREDTIFIAAALAKDNAAIWSDDKHFEQQEAIQIFKTKELVERYKDQ